MGLPLIGLTISQAGFSTIQKNQQAKVQEQMYQQNRVAAAQAGADQMLSDNMQTSNNLKAIAGQRMDIALEAARKVAEVENSAADSGLAGQSIDNQATAYHVKALREGTSLADQVKMMGINSKLTAKNVDAGVMNRVNSVQRGVEGNFFGELVGAGVKSFAGDMLNDPYAGAERVKKKKIVNDITGSQWATIKSKGLV